MIGRMWWIIGNESKRMWITFSQTGGQMRQNMLVVSSLLNDHLKYPYGVSKIWKYITTYITALVTISILPFFNCIPNKEGQRKNKTTTKHSSTVPFFEQLLESSH